jgi:HPt (histidine-containing phosphotransfer) domain-containing protein
LLTITVKHREGFKKRERRAFWRSAGRVCVSGSSAVASPDRERTPTVIDETHLERMTLGDRRLEREVLELFVRQTTIMLGRIVGADPALAAASAHTLKGSARGIGAWRVARAAELVEIAVTELKSASLEASAAIGARLSGLVAETPRTR